MEANLSNEIISNENRRVFPLSRLAESISAQIAKAFEKSYWIIAEVNKLNHYPHSGHCYPALVEKKAGNIVAEIRGFIQSGRFREIQQKFIQTTGKPLEDGVQILFHCKVGYHPLYGLSLNILDIEPSYTLGEMARQRKEALSKLKTEGVIAANKGLKMPLLLRRIAVISVETSKGWRDFMSIVDQSVNRNAINVQLYPALLQGDAAVGSILAALENIHLDKEKYDCVAIIRGGGGETGLDCYDNYLMARAVCNFPLPVLTGIGHATNLTVVEQVAARNLITPTDLGRFVTDGFLAFAERLNAAKRWLKNLEKTMLPAEIRKLESMGQKLEFALGNRLRKHKDELASGAKELESKVKNTLQYTEASLAFRYPARLGEASRSALNNKLVSCTVTKTYLGVLTSKKYQQSTNQLNLLSEKIRLLDPQNTLKRGFSITLKDGIPIKDASELQDGEILETIFARGRAFSNINSTKNE